MRCKVGDLVEIVSADKAPKGGVGCGFDPRGLVGVITGPAKAAHADWSLFLPSRMPPTFDKTWAARDKNLRPIKDPGAEDETLTWAGKPKAALKETQRSTQSEETK